MELYLGGGANYEEYVQHPVLAKHFDLIEDLAYDRTFGVFMMKKTDFGLKNAVIIGLSILLQKKNA